jgi:hypothetical protein
MTRPDPVRRLSDRDHLVGDDVAAHDRRARAPGLRGECGRPCHPGRILVQPRRDLTLSRNRRRPRAGDKHAARPRTATRPVGGAFARLGGSGRRRRRRFRRTRGNTRRRRNRPGRECYHHPRHPPVEGAGAHTNEPDRQWGCDAVIAKRERALDERRLQHGLAGKSSEQT